MAEAPATPDCALPPEATKGSYRRRVWEHLERHDLAAFPRPVHGRIPNFKGSDAAARRLAALPEFDGARCVAVCPDKAQEGVRRRALQAQKEVVMALPRLRAGLFARLSPRQLAAGDAAFAATARGARQLGAPLALDGVPPAHLLVVGSVAVSLQGFRIGKGEGFADLEYAVLMELNAIGVDVPVVTTVHDCQVFEELPAELFGAHDLLVDVVVTPTRALRTTARARALPRPRGVDWALLSRARLAAAPALGALRRRLQA